MTTPRQHAELAARYFADDTMKCWARPKNGGEDWTLMRAPSFNSSDLEYYVGHEPPPPIKRTITLTVNGKEWVLPEPLRGEPEKGATCWIDTMGAVAKHTWGGDVIDEIWSRDRRVHASESDAQAWADFDKWCRGGGHE